MADISEIVRYILPVKNDPDKLFKNHSAPPDREFQRRLSFSFCERTLKVIRRLICNLILRMSKTAQATRGLSFVHRRLLIVAKYVADDRRMLFYLPRVFLELRDRFGAFPLSR